MTLREVEKQVKALRGKLKEKYRWAGFELRHAEVMGCYNQPEYLGIEMQRLYPRTKFADEVTLEEQFDHICSEYREVLIAGTLEHRDEELADLEHSIQTYWDIRARQGVDVAAVRRAVVRKNAMRGYYS